MSHTGDSGKHKMSVRASCQRKNRPSRLAISCTSILIHSHFNNASEYGGFSAHARNQNGLPTSFRHRDRCDLAAHQPAKRNFPKSAVHPSVVNTALSCISVNFPAGGGPMCLYLLMKSVNIRDSQKSYEKMTLFSDLHLSWLLPGERPIGRVGFALTGDRRLSRHTGISGRPK